MTTYQDTGVSAGTHTYYVAAYNSSGVGTGSTPVTVTVTGTTGTTTSTTRPTTSGHRRS